jgi:hypothetical protein
MPGDDDDELIGGEVSPPAPRETRLGDKPQSGFLFEAQFDVLVPTAFAVTLPRRADTPPTRDDPWRALRRKQVVVRANGFDVRGRLEGVDDDDVYLRGELRWFVLPMSTITSVVRDPSASDDVDDVDDECD